MSAVEGACKRRPTKRITENGDPLLKKSKTTTSTTAAAQSTTQPTADPSPPPSSQPHAPNDSDDDAATETEAIDVQTDSSVELIEDDGTELGERRALSFDVLLLADLVQSNWRRIGTHQSTCSSSQLQRLSTLTIGRRTSSSVLPEVAIAGPDSFGDSSIRVMRSRPAICADTPKCAGAQRRWSRLMRREMLRLPVRP